MKSITGLRRSLEEYAVGYNEMFLLLTEDEP